MTCFAANDSSDGLPKVIYQSKDSEIVKKILKHLILCDVKCKLLTRANSPPTESFILYDESSSPSADDNIIGVDYPIDTSL